MFSKTITNSSNFLMMPLSSQGLYFHLGMNADDDGFCEHFAIMRMVEAKPDDLKILQAKGFIQIFDERVLVIRDWTENNYLRNDRYTPSKYLAIYKDEIKRLTSGIPPVDTGKDRIGKDRIGQPTGQAPIVDTPKEKKKFTTLGADLLKEFENVDVKNGRYYGVPAQRLACDWLIEQYGFELVKKVINALPSLNKMPYFSKAYTPCQLRDKWTAIRDFIVQEQTLRNKEKDKYKVI